MAQSLLQRHPRKILITSLTEALLKTIVDFPNLQTTFNNYKKNRYLSIQNLINEKKSAIDYHRVRKRIKDLTYLTEIQQTKLNIANNELILLKQLGTKLGDWHDLKVFLSELKLFKDCKKKKLAFYTEIENKLKQKQQVIIDEFYIEYKQLL